MKRFLKNIDLIDENKGEKLILDLDDLKDNEEWSPLYYSLKIIEKLLEIKQNKVVISANSLIQNLLVISTNHKIYWIRFAI